MIGRQTILFLRRSTTTTHIPRCHFNPGREGFERKKREIPQVFWVIPVVTFGLGAWQVKRKAWKENLIEELKAKVLGEAIPIPADLLKHGLEMADHHEFTPVTVRGKFDHSQEIHLGPRSKQSSLKANAQGGGLASSTAGTGWQIVTPFQLETGERILVNRGWVPTAKRDPSTRQDGQIEDTIEIRGIVRKPDEKPSRVMEVIDRAGTEWHYRDTESFAAILNTLPVFIDADTKGTGKGGPIGGQTPVHLRNEHLQYIITWWGICIASTVAMVKFRRF